MEEQRMSKSWKLGMIVGMVALMVAMAPTVKADIYGVRDKAYDAVINDVEVIADDIKTRALNTAVSKYASAVARLEVQTEKAKQLLIKKSREENTDPLVFVSWLDRTDAAHDEKLRELGQQRDRYIERWKQRYGTLERDAKVLRALKRHEQRTRPRCHTHYRRANFLGGLFNVGTYRPGLRLASF